MKYTKDILHYTPKKQCKRKVSRRYDLDDATPNEILRDVKIKLKYKEDANEKKVKRRLVSYFQVRKKTYFFLQIYLV